MILTLLLSFEASGKPSKISTDLSQVDQNANVRVIVQYVRQPDDTDHQKLLIRGGKLKRNDELSEGASLRSARFQR